MLDEKLVKSHLRLYEQGNTLNATTTASRLTMSAVILTSYDGSNPRLSSNSYQGSMSSLANSGYFQESSQFGQRKRDELPLPCARRERGVLQGSRRREDKRLTGFVTPAVKLRQCSVAKRIVNAASDLMRLACVIIICFLGVC